MSSSGQPSPLPPLGSACAGTAAETGDAAAGTDATTATAASSPSAPPAGRASAAFPDARSSATCVCKSASCARSSARASATPGWLNRSMSLAF